MVNDPKALLAEAKRIYGWVERHYWKRDSFVSISHGAPSAVRPITTDKDGKLDDSFLDNDYINETVLASLVTIGTWTPVVADAASGGNAATATVAYGEYIKINKLVWAGCRLTQINTTGLTAGNAAMVRGFPFLSSNDSSNYRATGTASVSNITFGGYLSINMLSNASSVTLVNNATGAAAANLLVSALTSGTALIQFSIVYKSQ